MNRALCIVAAVTAAVFAQGASADGCTTLGYSGGPLASAGIVAALSGKRVQASGGTEDWNEDHCVGGDLYRVGDGTAVDPRVKEGTWTSASNTATYNYTGGSSYGWSLYQDVTNFPLAPLCWEQTSGGGAIVTVTGKTTGSAGSPCN